MSDSWTRRRFLRAALKGGMAVGLGDAAAFLPWTPLRAADAKVTPDIVRFSPDIEPVVRLIEETPRAKCIPMMMEQLRGGLPYRRFLAAVFLAGIRKQNAHHEVFLIHSAHQLSLDARAEERLLPLFWALDNFKFLQERDPAPLLAPLDARPAADKAGAEFDDAMQRFDAERSERALVALARSEGGQQTMERLWRFAARDGSMIGHRGICVTNCWRAVQVIGWQHAEPVLRFTLRNLYARGGRQDGFYQPNLARVQKGIDKLSPGWAAAQGDEAATLELFALLRDGKSEQACELALTQLTDGRVRAGAIWDAVHLAAAEYLVRYKHGAYAGGDGLVVHAVHSNTSANALHYAFRVSRDADTRLLLLLQAVAWVSMFIAAKRHNLRDLKITELAGAKLPESAREAIDEIFSLLPGRKPFDQQITDRTAQDEATRKAFAFTAKETDAQLFMQTARTLLYRKATVDAHDYKFAAAMFEDYEWVSPRWRRHLLAASVHWLLGSGAPDSVPLQQAREALRKLAPRHLWRRARRAAGSEVRSAADEHETWLPYCR